MSVCLIHRGSLTCDQADAQARESGFSLAWHAELPRVHDVVDLEYLALRAALLEALKGGDVVGFVEDAANGDGRSSRVIAEAYLRKAKDIVAKGVKP